MKERVAMEIKAVIERETTMKEKLVQEKKETGYWSVPTGKEREMLPVVLRLMQPLRDSTPFLDMERKEGREGLRCNQWPGDNWSPLVTMRTILKWK